MGSPAVTLATACALTGLSERTLQRYVADERVRRSAASTRQRTLVYLDSVLDLLPAELSAQLGSETGRQMLLEADRGVPDAANDVALALAGAGLAHRAEWWLLQAAEHGHADAMHWLGRLHLSGTAGLPRNAHLGLAWLARSAAAGHVISRAMVAALLGPRRGGVTNRVPLSPHAARQTDPLSPS